MWRESSLEFPFDQFHLINKQNWSNCSVNFGSTNHSSIYESVRLTFSHRRPSFGTHFNLQFWDAHSIRLFSFSFATTFIWLSLTGDLFSRPPGRHYHFPNERMGEISEFSCSMYHHIIYTNLRSFSLFFFVGARNKSNEASEWFER